MVDDDAASALSALEYKLLARSFRSFGELSGLLSDDFVEFGRSGAVYTKTETVTALLAQKDQSTHSDAVMTNLGFKWLAPDIALLTYFSFRHDTDGSVIRSSLRSSIWRYTNKRWQMVFHQATPSQ